MSSMFGFLKPAPRIEKRERAPHWVSIKGGSEFPLAQHITLHEGYPVLDWEKARAWVEGVDAKLKKDAWTACERGWLLHLRDALGKDFRLDESQSAAIVSSLAPNVARAALEFMGRTLRRIGAVLDGIVQTDPWGKDILIVFDHEEAYYRYVSHYYPDSGEFAFSGGMHIDSGCSHFVTVKNDLQHLEATIVHEMAHACLGHLPLPLWLNEGLAVNTERRLAGAPRQTLGAADRTHERLRRFWSVVSIQDFWSGVAFQRPGHSNELSYELARILVEQLAKDWTPFRDFVLRADRADAGARAARECLGFELGDAVTALLERDTPKSWSPDPSRWKSE